MRIWRVILAALVSTSLVGCRGPRSALDPGGLEAERIATLFWWMVGGGTAIWLGVLALTWYCVVAAPESLSRRRAWWIIVGGGAILPTVVLGVLLGFGLGMLPGLLAPAPAGSLTIAVDAELWWWRVRYLGTDVVAANEIHLPVGEPVEFKLSSDNVLHSFWIPALGGKMDMIPGRETRLALTPTRVGVYRGICAEYCGDSHALMQFDVVVEEKADFQRWLARQAAPAARATAPLAVRGQEAFVTHGCGSCHTVRGLSAASAIAPDLTHVGSRLSIAAGTLTGGSASLQHWIGATKDLKPGAQMPKFSMLPPDDLRALAAYLESLK